MFRRLPWGVGLLAALFLAGPGRCQDVGLLLSGSQGASLSTSGQAILVPDGALVGRGDGPLFAPLRPEEAGGVFASGANPAVPNALSVGGVGGSFRHGTGVDIGFYYVRPLWTFRDFTLAVPAFGARSFPLLGDAGHVDDHFAIAPRVDLRYLLDDSNVGLGASGYVYNLNGHLQRQLEFTGGVGNLTANSSFTLISINLAEINVTFTGADLFEGKEGKQADCLDDLLVRLGVAARYASLDQNYTGTLSDSTEGVSVTTRFSTQSFSGFGISGNCDLFLPVGDDWTLYSRGNLSVLVGDNVRRSSLTLDLAGQPGLPNAISEDKTQYIPVAELELGVVWAPPMFSDRDPAARPFNLFVKAAAIGQYWGGVGPLSAGSSQAFRTSDVFLVGATLLVGLER
jgi:hypothetical protein